jgi:hypothetical protein
MRERKAFIVERARQLYVRIAVLSFEAGKYAVHSNQNSQLSAHPFPTSNPYY